MLDHVSFPVTDLARSQAFYAAALAPLGYKVLMSFPGVAGLGIAPKPDFWIGEGGNAAKKGVHIAFQAPDRATVRAFYDAALAAGATDNGPPGPRPHYHPNYYGAFVHDPDGYNVEVVCHLPE